MCAVVTGGSCDVVANTGCSAGHKCSASGTTANATSCDCAGSGVIDGGCTGDANGDTCGGSLVCLADNKCHKYCRVDTDCPSGRPCSSVLLLAGGVDSGFKICSPPTVVCTTSPGPVGTATGGACATGQGCYLDTPTAAKCADAGTLAAGAACMYLNDCRPGYVCVGTGTGSATTCKKVCKVDGDCPLLCIPLSTTTGSFGACG